jgi:hypothetical protein
MQPANDPSESATGKVIDTRTATAWMEGEHLLMVKVKGNAVVLLGDAREHVRAGQKMVGGKDYIYQLIDAREIKAISSEARQYYADPGSDAAHVNNLGIAIITGSRVSKVIANFFLTLNKPARPVKLFTKVSEGKKWLKSLPIS